METGQGKVDEAEAIVSEIDSLKLENGALQRELKSRNDAIAGLETSLADRNTEIAAVKQVAEDFKQKFDETDKALEAAIKAYLALAAEANPGPVSAMIKGGTIREIEESVKTARALIERIKQEVGAEAARIKVPAGAPPRVPPDLSGLTPREKIMYGMESPG